MVTGNVCKVCVWFRLREQKETQACILGRLILLESIMCVIISLSPPRTPRADTQASVISIPSCWEIISTSLKIQIRPPN